MFWKIRPNLVLFLGYTTVQVIALAIDHDRNSQGSGLTPGLSSSLPKLQAPNIARGEAVTVIPSPQTLFDISISDTDGNDISDRFSLHHDRRLAPSSPSQHLTKRGSRPLNSCTNPGLPFFLGSMCSRHVSAVAYTINCGSDKTGQMSRTPGACEESEICIDGVNWRNYQFLHHPVPHTAYCVSMNDFVQMAIDRTETKKDASAVDAASGVSPGMPRAGYAMEAVMTGLDHKSSVFTQSLNMQAQTLDVDKGMRLWRTLDHGTNQCTDCSSLALEALPIGTQRVKVDVVMKVATAVGLLYLASVAPTRDSFA